MKCRNSLRWFLLGLSLAVTVFVTLLFPPGRLHAQMKPLTHGTLQDPGTFLGYPLGSRFTFHHDVVAYTRYLATHTPHAREVTYGTTYEGRPLQALVVASPQHAPNLESIQADHMRRIRGERGDPKWDGLAIVWLSFGVHGNEAVCTESALEVMYRVCAASPSQFADWNESLQNVVVIIDPCLNPDGHDRYVSFFTSRASGWPNADPLSWEHDEPWPGGRVNHYLFDLNRDWAWLQQRESANRMAVMLQWMPHVHGDFHEMGIDSPYYFAPAAKPYHAVITDWQRDFQGFVGQTTANRFDRRGALFYTGEDFDLFYPSYGDTYPMYHGAIGLTYEQGGSSRAGVLVENSEGDELSLAFRIENHVESSLALLETSSEHAVQLQKALFDYHVRNRENPWGDYKTYVISGRNSPAKREALQAFLRAHDIAFGQLEAPMKKGRNAFSYPLRKAVPFVSHPDDWAISAHQTHGAFLQVLFDPDELPEDSMTYDLTGWALPFAWGLEAYALEDRLGVRAGAPPSAAPLWPSFPVDALGFAFVPSAIRDQRVIAQWLRAGLRLRHSDASCMFQGQVLPAGSYVCLKSDQKSPFMERSAFEQAVRSGWQGSMSPVFPLTSSKAQAGFDLGSEHWQMVESPSIALLGGPSVSALSMGEVWWHLEQELGYTISIIDAQRWDASDLERYDIVIVPAGYYRNGQDLSNRLGDWVEKGGTLIGIGSGLGMLEGDSRFGIKRKSRPSDSEDKPEKRQFANRSRENLDRSIEGAIYALEWDMSHPMGQGVSQPYFTLKNSSTAYEFLESGWSIGRIPSPALPVNGFAGHLVSEQIENSLSIGIQPIGEGKAIYFVDDPLFRGFWENGKMLFDNALWGESAR